MSESNPTLTPVAEVELPALLGSAQRGDSAAFGELCRIHEARLLRQALVLCGEIATAEDLAQDTLVAAWQSLARFNGRCRFFTWLCAILIRQHKRRLRAKQSWMRWFANDEWSSSNDTLSQVPDGAACPATAMASSERDAFLRRCLDALPEKHREVVFLRFYVEESLDGIATALDCSVGTVKSRLFHGLEKLRKMKTLTEHFRENETHL
ncbi:MAG: RNA polymerase sigma factor [Verrucomicrobia bacterium]|nr:RNA polymerase sigma factor [Verrucomicrobiota bacterium]